MFPITKKMKKRYYVIRGKYKEFEKPKTSYLLEKTLVLSVICCKCKNEDEKLFEEESIEILKIICLIEICNYFINLTEENISQEFRLKNIDETRNYLIEQINRNELMSKKHEKVCTALNYIENFLILGSTITGRVSVSDFASLVGIPIGIMSSAIGLKVCAITSGIEKYNSMIKKKKKMHDKIVLLAKSKLNGIEVLISKALFDSVISHDEFVLINIFLQEYDESKEEIRNLKT